MQNQLKVNVGKILFDNLTMSEVIQKTDHYLKNFDPSNDKSEFIVVANQDSITKIGKQLDATSINNSFITIPDGASIILASKILKTPLKERVAGPDFMIKMMELSNNNGYKQFFLGSTAEVIDAMKKKLVEKYPNLNIVDSYSPPFVKSFDDIENDKMLDKINNSNCDCLWVSFGCPKQENWIIKNIDRLKVPLAIGVGAAFDFHSGRTKRASLFMQKIGIEWVFRLFQEPKRLWKRYLIGGVSFLIIILKQKFKH